MCGIAGIVGHLGNGPQIVEAMLQTLRHRGPDGKGIAQLANHAVLGHVRLAIVDLQGGCQPMWNVNHSQVITFNGEIYGYKELRSKLDYPFQTHSDTEVLLAMYEKYGTGMAKKIPGMFSFAIWDEKLKRLYCARDRFGEKPFYYAQLPNGQFLFASEIKAILATGLVPASICHNSLRYFLQKGHIHPSQTIFENIKTLPPAHELVFQNGEIKVNHYWDFPHISDSISFEDALQEMKRLLQQAVSRQLVADVPVAAFLSSGLDSSTIVALAAEQNQSLHAYSFGFNDEFSETGIARQTANELGIPFVELNITESDSLDTLLQAIRVHDEPFADSSALPTFLICREAAKFTKVALTGDGGDELLGGYEHIYRPLLDLNLGKSRLGNRDFLFFLAKILWKTNCRSMAGRLFDSAENINKLKGTHTYRQAASSLRDIFSENELNSLLGHLGTANTESFPEWQIQNRIEDGINHDIETYMAGQILVKTDRASMANGLELRAPFLDRDFAEFAMALPMRMKINKKESKILFRRAFENLWNREVRSNFKRGFGSPISEWFKTPNFQVLINEYLKKRSSDLFSLLDFQGTQNLLANGRVAPQKIYSLLVLSLWIENQKSTSN